MGDKTSDDMLDEAIEAGLFPFMKWDGGEWFVYFAEQDGRAHGWMGVDKSRQRAIKKTYYSWKDIYFDDDID